MATIIPRVDLKPGRGSRTRASLGGGPLPVDTRRPPAPSPLLGTVSVNDVVISEESILGEAQHHPAADARSALMAAARALAVRELLLQRAAELGLEAGPAAIDARAEAHELPEDAVIRKLLDQEVRIPRATEEECARYYRNNRQRFDVAEGTVPFETARTAIARWLEARCWARAVAQYIALLAGRARLRGVSLEGSDSPLVR